MSNDGENALITGEFKTVPPLHGHTRTHIVNFTDGTHPGYLPLTDVAPRVDDVLVCGRCGSLVATNFLINHNQHHSVLARLMQRVLGWVDGY